MPWDVIARLTDRQIQDIIFHPRDERGVPKERIMLCDLPSTPENDRAVLFTYGRAMGISDEELERTWRAKYGEV